MPFIGEPFRDSIRANDLWMRVTHDRFCAPHARVILKTDWLTSLSFCV